MKKMKALNIAVFCVWIALMAVLLYRNYTGYTLDETPILKEAFEKKTYWYGIYAGEKKIGSAMTAFERVGDEIITKHVRELKVQRNGEESVLIEQIKTLGPLNYSVQSLEYSSHFQGEKGIRVTGEVDGGEIVFFLESPEKRKTHKASTGDRDFYLRETLISAVSRKDLVPRTPLLMPTLNFVSLSLDDVRVVLEEIIPMKVGANILSLSRFRVRDSIIWNLENTITVKEEHPSGVTLYQQSEGLANDAADRVLFDYTMLPFYQSNRVITDIEKLSQVKVRIRGFSIDPLLYKESFVTLIGDTLVIRKEDIDDVKEKSYTLPYNNGESLKEYLSPDAWVLSDYKPLYDTGQIYARSRKNDAFSFAYYLNGYLYGLIRTEPGFVLSNSKDILESLSGDYLERTVMYATYARAGGLPTRLVGGLVYINGYFYFHTWPEVWLNTWVPVDPTLAQFPADATHIPLKEGTLTDIISLVDDLKDMKIELLEAS